MLNNILMIYTGGTIGMLPEDEANPKSNLVTATWDRLIKYIPVFNDLELKVDLHQMPRLIDSSNMNPDYWIDIATVVEKNYVKYQGFVILHGTDTMTYTASALSFLLQNLKKPVILTGSQVPMSKPRSDAAQNFVTSLILAAPTHFNLPVVPEVCIFFRDVLLRGNRSRKKSSVAYAGFHSPNFPPLGRAGEHIEIDQKLVRYPCGGEILLAHKHLEKNVLMFDIFPGLRPEILKRLFDIEGLKGVILKTFGAGNAPTDSEFIDVIAYGIKEKGLAIVNITQCSEGRVEMGLYETSNALLRLGVISGMDMTSEAALVKMQYLLGLGYDMETFRELMQKDLRGEISLPKGI